MWCRVLQASHPHTAPPTLGLVGVCRNFIFRHAFPGPAGWLCGIAFWRRNGYGRLESGVPHQYVHYMDAERLRQYHTDSSMMARIPRLPSILFNVPEHVLNEIVKDSVNNLEYQLFNSWILCTITQLQLIKFSDHWSSSIKPGAHTSIFAIESGYHIPMDHWSWVKLVTEIAALNLFIMLNESMATEFDYIVSHSSCEQKIM